MTEPSLSVFDWTIKHGPKPKKGPNTKYRFFHEGKELSFMQIRLITQRKPKRLYALLHEMEARTGRTTFDLNEFLWD